MPRLLFAILALAVVPAALCAQSKKDDWENLKQLQTGHKIRVVEMDLKSWDGKLGSVSDEALTIREKRQQEITVERAKVFRVTDLELSRRGRNAFIGFLIGGAIGAPLGAAKSSDVPAPLGAVIVAGWLGGAGAGLGALIPSHPTIYRVQRGPDNTIAGSSGEHPPR